MGADVSTIRRGLNNCCSSFDTFVKVMDKADVWVDLGSLLPQIIYYGACLAGYNIQSLKMTAAAFSLGRNFVSIVRLAGRGKDFATLKRFKDDAGKWDTALNNSTKVTEFIGRGFLACFLIDTLNIYKFNATTMKVLEIGMITGFGLCTTFSLANSMMQFERYRKHKYDTKNPLQAEAKRDKLYSLIGDIFEWMANGNELGLYSTDMERTPAPAQIVFLALALPAIAWKIAMQARDYLNEQRKRQETVEKLRAQQQLAQQQPPPDSNRIESALVLPEAIPAAA